MKYEIGDLLILYANYHFGEQRQEIYYIFDVNYNDHMEIMEYYARAMSGKYANDTPMILSEERIDEMMMQSQDDQIYGWKPKYVWKHCPVNGRQSQSEIIENLKSKETTQHIEHDDFRF